MTTKMEEIVNQQVLLPDGSVFSIQWIVLPPRHAPRLSPSFLLERYLVYLRRATLSLIRPRTTAEGIEFGLVGCPVPMLTFSPPDQTVTPLQAKLALRISGGFLLQAQQCDRGEFTFRVEPLTEGVLVAVELTEFCPLLLGSGYPSRVRKLLYRLTQASIHKLVTVRFLALLYGELEGKKFRGKVVQVEGEQGERI